MLEWQNRRNSSNSLSSAFEVFLELAFLVQKANKYSCLIYRHLLRVPEWTEQQTYNPEVFALISTSKFSQGKYILEKLKGSNLRKPQLQSIGVFIFAYSHKNYGWHNFHNKILLFLNTVYPMAEKNTSAAE